jgi:hypothetical protein
MRTRGATRKRQTVTARSRSSSRRSTGERRAPGAHARSCAAAGDTGSC